MKYSIKLREYYDYVTLSLIAVHCNYSDCWIKRNGNWKKALFRRTFDKLSVLKRQKKMRQTRIGIEFKFLFKSISSNS